MISLKGKTVLITGASRGIGYLIAQFMAQQGCNLIVHSREIHHTESLLEKVSQYPIEAHPVAADFSDPDQVVKMLNKLDQHKQSIDIVFNNAGLQVAYRHDIWKTPVDDFRTSFQVNCIAVAMICYRLIPYMTESGFGRVINVTSGIKNEPEQAGYSASKAALDKFTRDLANKVDGSNVLVNLTDPGWCRTDLGGPMAPNDPANSLPGVVVGAFVNDHKSGRIFQAEEFSGLSLKQAVQKAETIKEA